MTTSNQIEAYLSGEASPEEIEAIERAERQDQVLSDYLTERRAERDAFLMDPRRRSFASLVEEAERGERSWLSTKWLGVGFGIALAAAAAFAVMSTKENAPGIQTKGGLSLKAAVLEDGKPRFFDASTDLHPGDRLRFTVDDPGGGYVTVILEESSGGVDVMYEPGELGELNPGSHTLPGSLELDGTLGRERIYVIMSNERPDPKTWAAEIEKAHGRSGFNHGWLPPRGSRVSTIEYDKVTEK